MTHGFALALAQVEMSEAFPEMRSEAECDLECALEAIEHGTNEYGWATAVAVEAGQRLLTHDLGGC